jgi:hypothetical protein
MRIDHRERKRNMTCQFSRGTDNEGAKTIEWPPFLPVEQLEDWNEKGQRLPTSCSCCSKDIFALESIRQGTGLDRSEFCVKS